MDRSRQIACTAIASLEDHKGQDIRIIDIHDVTVIADYFIIAGGSNINQVKALADHDEEALGRKGFTTSRIEGYNSASWILMDYGDVVIHIFSKESRQFYDLERIWRDGKNMDPQTFMQEEAQEEV